MAPRMVLIEARKTGAVPKPWPAADGLPGGFTVWVSLQWVGFGGWVGTLVPCPAVVTSAPHDPPLLVLARGHTPVLLLTPWSR